MEKRRHVSWLMAFKPGSWAQGGGLCSRFTDWVTLENWFRARKLQSTFMNCDGNRRVCTAPVREGCSLRWCRWQGRRLRSDRTQSGWAWRGLCTSGFGHRRSGRAPSLVSSCTGCSSPASSDNTGLEVWLCNPLMLGLVPLHLDTGQWPGDTTVCEGSVLLGPEAGVGGGGLQRNWGS